MRRSFFAIWKNKIQIEIHWENILCNHCLTHLCCEKYVVTRSKEGDICWFFLFFFLFFEIHRLAILWSSAEKVDQRARETSVESFTMNRNETESESNDVLCARPSSTHRQMVFWVHGFLYQREKNEKTTETRSSAGYTEYQNIFEALLKREKSWVDGDSPDLNHQRDNDRLENVSRPTTMIGRDTSSFDLRWRNNNESNSFASTFDLPRRCSKSFSIKLRSVSNQSWICLLYTSPSPRD